MYVYKLQMLFLLFYKNTVVSHLHIQETKLTETNVHIYELINHHFNETEINTDIIFMILNIDYTAVILVSQNNRKKNIFLL